MTYPKFKNKHLEEALWNPKDFKKGGKPKNFPKKFIIIYWDKIINSFKKKYHPKKIKLNALLSIYQYKDIGVAYLRGFGCPCAVCAMEDLIAKGGKIFLNIGTAGGLRQEGIFLCEKALRDEGTSYHYAPHGEYSYPDKQLTEKLAKSLEKQRLNYKRGINWTIDAPYRETKAEIKKYSKQGISTVEMEASALFVLAKYRKVKIASAFIVSDTLIKKRKVIHHRTDFKKDLNKLMDAGVECLR